MEMVADWMIALDGKKLRGSGTADGAAQHLPASPRSRPGIAPGRSMSRPRPNEIPMFTPLPALINLAGVITATPGLRGQLTALPWRRASSPAAPAQRPRPRRAAHPESGRHGRRTGLPIRRPGHPGRALQATAYRDKIVRRHRLHRHLADRHPGQARRTPRHRPRPQVNRRPAALGPFVDWDEDRSEVRTGNRPRVMASLGSLAITILCLTGEKHDRRPALPHAPTRQVAANDHELPRTTLPRVSTGGTSFGPKR